MRIGQEALSRRPERRMEPERERVAATPQHPLRPNGGPVRLSCPQAEPRDSYRLRFVGPPRPAFVGFPGSVGGGGLGGWTLVASRVPGLPGFVGGGGLLWSLMGLVAGRQLDRSKYDHGSDGNSGCLKPQVKPIETFFVRVEMIL
jgi:hypothetical protein